MKKKSIILNIFIAALSFCTITVGEAAIFYVTTTAGTGAGSIDAAVTAANGNGTGKDTIYFNIPGAGPHTINLGITLQAINGNVLIDAVFMQTGYNALNPVPVVEIINTSTTTFAVIGGACEIKGLAFNSTNGHGLLLNTSNNKVTGCYFGLGLDGTTDKGNQFHGIQINGGSNNIIGGLAATERNIISGNDQQGIQINGGSNNRITGNYIGTNAAGNSAVANQQHGIGMYTCMNNVVEQNIISGNIQHGILVNLGSDHFIIGNSIGTNAVGSSSIPNMQNGIEMYGSSSNQIGGTFPDSSNIVSGNHIQGIHLSGSSTNKGMFNRIFGNIVGLQSNGDLALGNNNHGIGIEFNVSVQIGGKSAALGNLISANGIVDNSNGINIVNSSLVSVRSNIIGTSQNTTVARGNGSHGIQIDNSPGTIVGGDHATEGNIISANISAGINFEGTGSKKSIVKGNYIGTDKTATMALGNGLIGIILKSDSCTIGGTANGEGNVIADTRLFCGLLIANANANVIKGNFIGVGINGTTPLPNKTDGINISVENGGQSASNNIIQFNTIAYNTIHGINVGNALNNFNSTNELNNNLRFNFIYCNHQLGISLTLSNAATQGNNGKTAPAINNALSTSSKVTGLANGLLATDLVDIYEMSECINCDQNPQGKRYITTVSPDAAGNWSFDNGSPITGVIIAMVTDAQGNSSQFSLCFTPCSAKATVNPTEYNAMLEMNKPLAITLTSSSAFSTINPEPGKIYWSMGTADTTAPALISKASSVTLTFEPGKNNASSYAPGAYTVYLIAVQSGCKDTATVKLNLFYIPNMITPNGDHKNDNWEVTNAPGQFDARIYNRWGDLVYSKSDYTNEWNGADLNDGVYYYLLEDKIQSGKSYKGWVQIIK